jgi:DNA-binding PadR family transcriptional regulator
LAILVALAEEPKIGSAVQSQIIGDTLGHYVGDSALYDVLHRLEGRGLVAATGKRYSLTDQGWHRLKVETRMFKILLENATRRLARHEAHLVLAEQRPGDVNPRPHR